MSGGAGGEELLTVTVLRDEHGYGMKVSGDNPVYVQSVKEHGAAWRAGLRAGDRILRVDGVPVHRHTHQQVVLMIRANPSTILTVHQNTQRLKTPITAPVPVNLEKQRQLEFTKVSTFRMMLENEQKYIADLRNELSKVPDVRKQAELENAQKRSAKLQREIDALAAAQIDRPPILHARSQSSPEHLDHGLTRPASEPWQRGTPPPGTPPPPYAHNTQPCADPQRAIISMEEDDSPTSETSCQSGLFSNVRSVRDSAVRTAVLLNWLLGERRCACACLLLVLTDTYRAAAAPLATLRRWAYELQSTFLMPQAVLQLSGVDENMANEIEHVLSNEYEKEELLRNVFRKARQRAKEELARQLGEFQVKRQLGLAALYGPPDAVLDKCDADKAQEQLVVERVLCGRLSALAAEGGAERGAGGAERGADERRGGHALLAALTAAALALRARPAAVAAAAGGARAAFLQRDKLYKQRLKQLAKQHAQPFVVRGHHLQLQALTSVAHCHACELPLAGLAPQAAVCTDCLLRVHRACARDIEESCCLDSTDHQHKRMSRFMERIHAGQDSNEKKARKTSGTANFLNMERSFRKMEDEPTWEGSPTNNSQERRDESDESLYESADCQSDAISASDDALPRLIKTPTMSKESLKLAVTDEEVDVTKVKKGHRKAMSLSNPLEMVKNIDWLDAVKKEHKNDIKKSRESLWSEEERDPIGGSTVKLDQIRKNSKKDKSLNGSRKSSTTEQPNLRKSSKSSSVSALSLFRRKKTPTAIKTVEAVAEVFDKLISTDEILQSTKFFLEEEKKHSSICDAKPVVETDTDDEDMPQPKPNEHRRRLSRQTSRSKSKVRGKSQSVKVNTLRKSHSGTLKKAKKKGVKTPIAARSRQTSIVEATPLLKKKKSESTRQSAWLFSSAKGEARREGSSEEPQPLEPDAEDTKEQPDKDNNWRAAPSGRGVNRAESCRERDAPRRGKHRNASDPNRLTAHNHHDLEPGAAAAPSGSSSSSSLSSRSNESNTVPNDHHASTSDWSDEEEPLAAAWADSVPPRVRDELLPAKLRKRQEVIHELILSEGSHVRWLKVLGVMFLRPLEAAPALLPADELRALFPNLPAVRERHTRLYNELRALRSGEKHVVSVGDVADAMLNTLGDPGYASSLARFCRGQRMALDSLRERRRKHKELHAFLAAREQHPRCTRLQLRDLLACVWQRLTKYQLLLESIQATSEAGALDESEAQRLNAALKVAKDVLHQVDTAVRTAENQHRLRTIQSKLEVRASGSEWDELRRLDLTGRVLRTEGELAIRNDTNKKIHVLGLMLEDMLVLLQREGDKFILKPITPPSQQGMLSPLIRWDTVLFRPNAAVRNTFFLMNINGVQMHELSTHTNAEYTTWVRYIQQAPLAKLTELKPQPHAPRSNDDSGINVSRNPSDASEKSSSTAPADEHDQRPEPTAPDDPAPDLGPDEGPDPEQPEDRTSEERTVNVDEERHAASRRVDAISPPLESRAALRVTEPVAAHQAITVLQHDERLRRLDAVVHAALRAKSACVARLLGAAPAALPLLADLAVSEVLGDHDIAQSLQAEAGEHEREHEHEHEHSGEQDAPQLHHLLLAAYAQANQLTETLSMALSVPESAVHSAPIPGSVPGSIPGSVPGSTPGAAPGRTTGYCGSCRRQRQRHNDTLHSLDEAVCSPAAPPLPPLPPRPLDAALLSAAGLPVQLAADLGGGGPLSPGGTSDQDTSYDMLPDLGMTADGVNDCFEGTISSASLARRLLSSANGVQRALSRALSALPEQRAERRAERARAAASQDRAAATRHRRRHDYQMMEEAYLQTEGVDQTIQDQPSNGG